MADELLAQLPSERCYHNLEILPRKSTARTSLALIQRDIPKVRKKGYLLGMLAGMETPLGSSLPVHDEIPIPDRYMPRANVSGTEPQKQAM